MKIICSDRVRKRQKIQFDIQDPLLYTILSWNEDMKTFGYGIYKNGDLIEKDFTEDDLDDYRIASPTKFVHQNGGVCWDFVTYEAQFIEEMFSELADKYTCWFVCFDNEDDEPTHTFLTFRYNDMTYYFESSFGMIQGVWCAESDDEIVSFVLEKMDENANGTLLEWPYYVFKYDALDPNIPGMGASEFMAWMFNTHESYRHEIDDYDVMKLH